MSQGRGSQTAVTTPSVTGDLLSLILRSQGWREVLGVAEDWSEIPPLRTPPLTLGPISAQCRWCQNTWLVLQEQDLPGGKKRS